MTDSPGEDGVAGDHQVVDTQGYQGAVVGRHTGRAQDLEIEIGFIFVFQRISRVPHDLEIEIVFI